MPASAPDPDVTRADAHCPATSPSADQTPAWPRVAIRPVLPDMAALARLSAREMAPLASSMSRVVCRTCRPTSSYCCRMFSRFSSACRQSALAAARSASVALSPRLSKAFCACCASRLAPVRSMRSCTRVELSPSSSLWREVMSLRKLVTLFFIPVIAALRLSWTLMAILASVDMDQSPSSLRLLWSNSMARITALSPGGRRKNSPGKMPWRSSSSSAAARSVSWLSFFQGPPGLHRQPCPAAPARPAPRK